MAYVELSDIRNWMLDTMVSKVEDQLNREILACDMFQKLNVNWTDGKAIVPIQYARNTSGAYRTEYDAAATSTLPTAEELGRARLTVDAKFLYSRMLLSGPAIISGRNNPHGLKATLREEIDGCLESLKNRANNYFFSGGGCVGYVMQKAANMNLAAMDFFGNAEHLPPNGGAALNCTLVRMDTYQTLVTAAPSPASNIKLSAAASSATAGAQVVIGTAIDSSAVPAGVPIAVIIDQNQIYNDTSVETVAMQPIGMYSNLSLPTHFQVDRTTATGRPALQSNFEAESLLANGNGATLTSGRLQKIITAITRQSDKRPELFLCEHGFLEEYVAILTATLQTQTRAKGGGGDGSFNEQQLTFGGLPFKASRHCGKGLLVAMNKSSWNQCTLAGPGMADLDGNVLSRLDGKDAWEGFARWYHNLVCKRPNANGVYTGFSYS